MRKWKRILTSALLATAAGALVLGCGPAPEEPAFQPPPEQQQQPLPPGQEDPLPPGQQPAPPAQQPQAPPAYPGPGTDDAL